MEARASESARVQPAIRAVEADALDARVQMEGDFATGLRTLPCSVERGDFATGVRNATTPRRTGDFATGCRLRTDESLPTGDFATGARGRPRGLARRRWSPRYHRRVAV
jgi:hypothetical protein